MDYTLAQYRPETFEVLAYELTVNKLIEEFDYPPVSAPLRMHFLKHCCLHFLLDCVYVRSYSHRSCSCLGLVCLYACPGYNVPFPERLSESLAVAILFSVSLWKP